MRLLSMEPLSVAFLMTTCWPCLEPTLAPVSDRFEGDLAMKKDEFRCTSFEHHGVSLRCCSRPSWLFSWKESADFSEIDELLA